MGCKAAIPTDEYHGWECEITEGACMFLHPDSKRCAKEYGEGPDAVEQEEQSLKKRNFRQPRNKGHSK